jgi:hypothetical protein
MALKEIARFYDLGEAQAAAGLLRSGGLPVFVDRELAGTALAMAGYAAGSYSLWVAASAAEDAKALIAELRAQPPEHPISQTTPANLSVTALTALFALSPFGLIAGWLVSGAARRPKVWRWATVAVFAALIVFVIFLARA